MPAYSGRPGTSNRPTEAINGRLEHLRGSALGFRNLGIDSRPRAAGPNSAPTRDGEVGRSGDGSDEPWTPAPAGPLSGQIPPGFAARVNLTIPEATLTRRAGRPGELAGIGLIEPNPEANT